MHRVEADLGIQRNYHAAVHALPPDVPPPGSSISESLSSSRGAAPIPPLPRSSCLSHTKHWLLWQKKATRLAKPDLKQKIAKVKYRNLFKAENEKIGKNFTQVYSVPNLVGFPIQLCILTLPQQVSRWRMAVGLA